MYYFEEGNPEIGKKLLQEAISYYRQKGLKSQEAYLWEQLGNYLYYNGKKRYRPDESLDCYSRSVNLYEASGDIFKAMQAAALKTAIYLARGEYDEIERTYITVHNGYKRINYYGENDIAALEWLIYIANSKSEFYTELSFALEILDNLNKYPKDFSDSRKEKVYYRLSEVYRAIGNYPKSEFYARKNLPLTLKTKISYIPCMFNLVSSIVKQGRPREALEILWHTVQKAPPDSVQKMSVFSLTGDIYKALHKNTAAEHYYLLAIKFNNALDPEHKNISRLTLNYHAIIDFYVSTNNFQKAEPYLKELNLKKSAISPVQKSKVALLQSRVDSAAGRYLPALQSYQFYKHVNDTIFNLKKADQLNQLEVAFESKQKTDKINLLAAQNKANLIQAQRANLERNLTVAGIIVMFIISGITLIGIRNKIRSNSLLKAKKEEIDQKNENLQLLLNEKEVLLTEKETLLGDKDMLLKEVHHRVKNNLQIVMSLLSTQVAYLENKDAVQAVEESQQRVHAIALIHQKLYREAEGVSIQMKSYVADMVDDLAGFFDAFRRGIRFKVAIDEIYLDIDQAVPLGLILNEAITNAIKYAFDKNGGVVYISLQKNRDAKSYTLLITDNGKGLPPDFLFEKADSLGMVMMKGLGGQLRGTFEIINVSGLTLSLNFPAKENTFS